VEWDYEFDVLLGPVDNSTLVRHVRLPSKMTMHFEHTGHGDRDFHGNGPRMNLGALLSDGASNSIEFALYGSAVETGGDCTEGSGFQVTTIYEPPAGFEIVEILDGLGRPMGGHAFEGLLRNIGDSSHDVGIFNFHQLATYRVFGDHRGNDLNGYSRIEMFGANLNVLAVMRSTSPANTNVEVSGTGQLGGTANEGTID